jgi:hypothetical protein
VSAAVRSLFAFESFAVKGILSVASKKKAGLRTSTLRLSYPRPDLASANAYHAKTFRLVECTDFFFCLTKWHPVLKFA